MSLSLSLHAGFALHRDGEEIHLKSRKAQALLVYLVLTGRPQSRTHLATLLWGERFEDQARSSLRQSLYSLRRAVGDGVVLGEDRLSLAEGALETQGDGSGRLLEEFVSGEDAFDSWLDGERRKKRKEAAFARFEKARQKEQAGDPDDALATIREAVALEPLAEQIVRFEIALLAGLGRRTEALTRHAEFASLLEQELDAAPEAETVALAERIRSDDVQVAAPGSEGTRARLDSTGGFNILIAPFEDLGGGDTATFLARDLPTQIVHSVPRQVIAVNLLPETQGGDKDRTPLQRAAGSEAVWLLSGSVRQIGSRVRVTMSATDVMTGSVTATDATLISADEAFEYLDSVADIVSVMWRSRYLKLNRYDQMVIDRLKLAKDRPEHFHSIVQELFYQTFFSNYSRASLSALEHVADFAISEFPNQADYHAIKGWAHFSHTDLLDVGTRLEGIRMAKSIFEHAVLLQPDLGLALAGLASTSYWLGHHHVVEELLKKSNASATALPTIDVIKGNSAMFCGRNDEAIKTLTRVIEKGAGLATLANWYATLAMAHFNKGECETAVSLANIALEFSAQYWLSYLVKMAALARLGRDVEAREAVAAYHLQYPGANVHELDWLPFSEHAAKANFLDALRDAGLPE